MKDTAALIAAAGIGSPFDRGRSLQMEKITRFFKKLLYFVASVVVIKLEICYARTSALKKKLKRHSKISLLNDN